ncbi:hypothetical protein ACJIZ3_000585 [Penstemon smallii]|uniref:DUF4218 domain-containing protein n=1 Tax=Penstemon smallii TaxID=265156 RepID=A0ABD3R226_9LAMI
MVHLTIHLATEAKIGGPVHYRWMYPVERYLCTLKSYVRNRSRPEGSIAEGYLAQECMGFCSLYLSDEVDTRFNQLGRNDDRGGSTREGLDIFSRVGRPLGKAVPKVLDEQILEKAHRYVLFNCDAVLPYISQHVDFIEEQHSRSRKHEKKRLHSETFATWFSDYVSSNIN